MMMMMIMMMMKRGYREINGIGDSSPGMKNGDCSLNTMGKVI
jgi:hypothetical protein